MYIDRENAVFYQQAGKDFIVYRLNAADGKPVAGKDMIIEYDGEKACLTQMDSHRKTRTIRI